MELHSSTHELIGVILPEITHSILVVDDRSIDIRISSLDGMMTMITGTATPEPRQEEPGRTLGVIHVSFWSETRPTAESTVSALAV